MYDIVIRNGLVVDGDGEAGVRADVAIQDGRIAAMKPEPSVLISLLSRIGSPVSVASSAAARAA